MDLTTIYFLLQQLLYLLAWTGLLAGSVVFLRRGYAGGAVSTLLGAAIAWLGAGLSLAWFALSVSGHPPGPGSPRIMIAMGIPSLAGIILFALGFLHLARITRKED